jgi:Pilin (bacterial filament)
MKNFATTLFAAIIGVLIVLFAYDRLVLQPRADALLATRVKPPELEKARSEAQAIADDLDASVKRSVDGARTAMANQASEADRRRLASDALVRAASLRVAMTEFYQTNMAWPDSAKDVGLGDPRSYAGGAVSSIAIAKGGTVVVTLDDTFSPASRIVYTPHANENTGIVDWRCVVEGADELRRYLLACKG